MRTRPSHFAVLILSVGLLGSTSQAFGQATTQDPASRFESATIRTVWKRVLENDPGAATALKSATTTKAKQVELEKLLKAFLAAPEFKDAKREGLSLIVNEMSESGTATATNAALTNPSTNQLLERSGLTNLIALSTDLKKLFSANDSAVSLSLNAIALVGGAESDKQHSAPYRYAQHEAWRRLGGTITFGAKIPEKEITGISGLPDSETLFDAFSWDIKVRLAGDRDSRASRWSYLLIGLLGDKAELLARVPVEIADTAAFTAASTALLGKEMKAAAREIESSLQVSVKAAGVHLTNVSGKNKYTFATMVDKGFSGLDLTLNASYNVADSTNAVTGPYSARDFQLAAGLTGSILKDVLVSGRGAELTASFKGQLVNDGANATADRRNTFNLNATLTLPFQEKGKIPVSITWTNDPNNLTKQKYVRGQIGLSYDFGSIFGMLKEKK